MGRRSIGPLHPSPEGCVLTTRATRDPRSIAALSLITIVFIRRRPVIKRHPNVSRNRNVVRRAAVETGQGSRPRPIATQECRPIHSGLMEGARLMVYSRSPRNNRKTSPSQSAVAGGRRSPAMTSRESDRLLMRIVPRSHRSRWRQI